MACEFGRRVVRHEWLAGRLGRAFGLRVGRCRLSSLGTEGVPQLAPGSRVAVAFRLRLAPLVHVAHATLVGEKVEGQRAEHVVPGLVLAQSDVCASCVVSPRCS